MKKKQIKTIVIFFLIIFICLLAGYITGLLMGNAASDFDAEKALEAIKNALKPIAVAAYIAISAIMLVLCAYFYAKAQRLARSWDGEDEDTIHKTERTINLANILSGGMMVLNCMLFPISVYLCGEKDIICEICFIATFAWVFTVNGLLVRLEKKLNPEKRGSVFDINFQKKWYDSSDEAQKIAMYRAGYKAYRVTNILCMIMWVISCMGIWTLGIGISAMIMVCIIWFSSIITYAVTAMKLDG